MNHLDNAKREMQAAFDLGEVPPFDTMERAMFRANLAIDLMYDREPDDEGQPVRDLLTDLVHYADAHDIHIKEALNQAMWMANEERKDWGLEPIDVIDRMFRRPPALPRRRDEP